MFLDTQEKYFYSEIIHDIACITFPCHDIGKLKQRSTMFCVRRCNGDTLQKAGARNVTIRFIQFYLSKLVLKSGFLDKMVWNWVR